MSALNFLSKKVLTPRPFFHYHPTRRTPKGSGFRAFNPVTSLRLDRFSVEAGVLKYKNGLVDWATI